MFGGGWGREFSFSSQSAFFEKVTFEKNTVKNVGESVGNEGIWEKSIPGKEKKCWGCTLNTYSSGLRTARRPRYLGVKGEREAENERRVRSYRPQRPLKGLWFYTERNRKQPQDFSRAKTWFELWFKMIPLTVVLRINYWRTIWGRSRDHIDG